jgi:hypothetical protein
VVVDDVATQVVNNTSFSLGYVLELEKLAARERKADALQQESCW